VFDVFTQAAVAEFPLQGDELLGIADEDNGSVIVFRA
jgi:hypothetical protein